jgi:hypothetical protein
MHLSLQNNYAARAACDATRSLLRVVGHFQRCSTNLSNAMALCALTPHLLLVECPTAAHALALFPTEGSAPWPNSLFSLRSSLLSTVHTGHHMVEDRIFSHGTVGVDARGHLPGSIPRRSEMVDKPSLREYYATIMAYQRCRTRCTSYAGSWTCHPPREQWKYQQKGWCASPRPSCTTGCWLLIRSRSPRSGLS